MQIYIRAVLQSIQLGCFTKHVKPDDTPLCEVLKQCILCKAHSAFFKSCAQLSSGVCVCVWMGNHFAKNSYRPQTFRQAKMSLAGDMVALMLEEKHWIEKNRV